MAQNVEPRRREWIAFMAGAVAMLAVALVVFGWLRMRDTAGTLRADMALPHADLPSLPDQPPPEGPRAPRLPLPVPK
jgi:hypothetical protein